MKITHYQKVKASAVDEDGAHNVSVRWLVSQADGARNFAMRLFELGAEGATPLHTHAWEHEVFVLSGEGKVFHEGRYEPIGPGTVVHVLPEEKHCFQNDGGEPLRFLCMIPL